MNVFVHTTYDNNIHTLYWQIIYVHTTYVNVVYIFYVQNGFSIHHLDNLSICRQNIIVYIPYIQYIVNINHNHCLYISV